MRDGALFFLRVGGRERKGVTQRLKVKGGGVGWADFRNDFSL